MTTDSPIVAGGRAEYAAPVLLAGLAAGLLGQGGYAGRTRVILAVLVAAAWSLTVRLPTGPLGLLGPRRVTPVRAALAAAGLLAGWALVDGALHGDALAGAGPALLAVGVATALCTGRQLSDAGRDVLLGGLVAVGLLIAAAGWLGVAVRLHTWAWQAQGLWRASSTLSYPNATAAVLAPLALIVLARLTERRSVTVGLAATGLLTGLGATGSRAGLLAAVTGLAVLAAMRGPRRVMRAAVGPVLGTVVAIGGLLPSIPVGSPPRPALAAAALAAGLTVAAVLPRLLARATALVAGGVGALVAGGVAVAGASGALPGVAAARVTLASEDRVDALRAAFRLLAASPLVGTGPGSARLHWTSPDGVAATMPYVHNEYVQVAVELGAIGAALLAGLVVAVGWMLRTERTSRPERALRDGAVAGLAAFAVHSALDFGWHLPAIPLLMATLVGLAARSGLPGHPRLSAEPAAPSADRAPSDGTPVALLAGPISPDPIPYRRGSS